MQEIKPYIFSEVFSGNWQKFKEAFLNPETIIFYDGDGVLFDTPKVVLKKFTSETGVTTDPAEIDDWSYLTSKATRAGLPEEIIHKAEDDWYNSDVLVQATRYLYMRPVVRETVRRFGARNNFILTAREPRLADSTRKSISKCYPEIPLDNLLIRSDTGIDLELFKVDEIRRKAEKAPWVILVDDAIKNVRSALDAGIDNLLVVNIPLGLVRPNFTRENLIVVRRFPNTIQAMYPLMDAINRTAR